MARVILKDLQLRPQYTEGICKRRSHSDKSSDLFVHNTAGQWRNLKTQQPQVSLDLCLKKIRAGKSYYYYDAVFVENLRFQIVFRPHEKKIPAFSKPSGLEMVKQRINSEV